MLEQEKQKIHVGPRASNLTQNRSELLNLFRLWTAKQLLSQLRRSTRDAMMMMTNKRLAPTVI
ncbi:unnamed protein product [Amoebophrya sp. A25]|nr:unnamed protein product [Amoebophrya sp. A25]|eukprot:GSA25T00014448001.1